MTTGSPADRVLVVGLGPTGVVLAGLLGQRGVEVDVFDKMPALHPLPRAVGMDHEVMRVAQELGVADLLHDVVVPYRASQYRGVDGQVIRRLDSPPPPHRLGWDPMFAFDQPAFEAVLRRRVAELPTVTASTSTEVLEIGQDDDHVWARVRRPGGEEETVVGAYLVGADGGASPVRRALGVTLTDLGFHENWLVVDAIVGDDAMARLPDTHVQYCDPTRPATYVNLVGRHRRWEIALEPGELPVGPVDGDAVWSWLDRWIEPGEAEIWRAAAYLFHGLVADEWRRGRVLLAGDAAHMTPPFMAQGMAQGVRDAQNLAWKLHAVMALGADPLLLDTYQIERRPHVVTTTEHTIALGRTICERDPALARARDEALLAPCDGEVPVTLRSTFLPPLEAGPLVSTTPGAGEIAPQPLVVTDTGVVLLDDVAGPGWQVLSRVSLTRPERDELEAAVAVLGGGHVRGLATAGAPTTLREDPVVLVERDGIVATWLADLEAGLVVARPDHYVLGTARSARGALDLLDGARRSYWTSASCDA
jgi:3-(3-hydroxy-phenyl)propionate hydroxylase